MSKIPPKQNAKKKIHASKLVFLIQLGFVVAVSLLIVFAGGQPPLYFVGIAAMLIMMLRVKTRGFVVSFAPFLLLFITYLMIRAFADDISPNTVNILGVVSAEKMVFFGNLPTQALQNAIIKSPALIPITWISDVLYLSHFITPVVLALLIWNYKKERFYTYMIGLIGVSYAGFLLFMLFPTAPPWWAMYYGYLSVDDSMFYVSTVPLEALLASPNPVAAMPSLHASYSLYVALVAFLVWGKRFWWVFFYPAAVALAVVYLGHHYAIDVFAGWGLVGVLWLVTHRRVSKTEKRIGGQEKGI